MKRVGWIAATLVICLAGPVAADDEKEKESAEPTETVKVGPVNYTIPKSWKRQAPSSSMRAAQFGIPLAEGDEGRVEVIVYYFGPDQGGSVDANIDRWKKQFQKLDGEEKVESVQVGDLDVTIFDASGTYEYKPFPAAPRGEMMEGWRMLAGIVEAPVAGSYYFRMVGPSKTIAEQEKAFKTMLKKCESAE